MRRLLTIALLVPLLATRAAAADAADPIGEPVMEPATILCLGMRWIVRGDDNANAAVAVAWRASAGKDQAWKDALPLHRVHKGMNLRTSSGRDTNASSLSVPDDAWIFAGSILGLEPGTAYEVRLTLADPDGGKAEKILKATTRSEPVLPPGTLRHVVPGAGGGSGTDADPFRGIAAAQASAKPGDRFLLRAGTYAGEAVFTASGEPGKPIAWCGPEDGEALLDGGGGDRAAVASDVHDLWFARLTIANASFGMVCHGSRDLVITRCAFRDVGYGFTAHDHGGASPSGFFIADNHLTGRMKWILPFEGDPLGDEQWHNETRGIEVGGVGHVVCRNAVEHFKDGIDLVGGAGGTCDCDIYRNLLTECIDDGIEMDYSERNCRVFENRIVNTHTGISIQPVFGGPGYIVRNLLSNVHGEVLKIHNCPSGVLFLHNTSVHRGPPFLISTGDKSTDIVFRNNLFIGTEGRAMGYDEPGEAIDLDYDGFGGFSTDVFLKIYEKRYSLAEVRAGTAPAEKHAVIVDPATAFAAGTVVPADAKSQAPHEVDFRLKTGTAAIDAGERLPGINDGFTGKAPDLGAIEFGSDAPPVGPQPVGAAKPPAKKK